MSSSLSCSRGSIPNPRTGRCKTCTAYTRAELQSIARSKKLSTSGTKDELCQRLVAYFMKKMGSSRSRGRSTSRGRSSTRSRSKSASRGRKRTTSATKKKSKASSKPRARSRSSSYYRSKAPRKVQTWVDDGDQWVVKERKYYPTKGRGSFQKRHHSSKRKGPSLPANAHCGETARGNDGNIWESRPDKNGRCAWRRF